MSSLKNNTSDIEQLRLLLLGSEIKQLKELEVRFEKLKEDSYNKDTLIPKVTTLFNEVLLNNFKEHGDKTVEIFSTYISQIIKQAYIDTPEELSEVLKETIAEAISKEIENNKDAMIDSLYPIIGGMISKYVTQAIKEMMENINTKIEDGLSFNKYERKVKSKLTGVSESELLMRDSSSSIISSLFIIQKESGMLIAQAQLEDKAMDDPHMVASMASAIKDFINDWVDTNQSQKEIQILSYGDATLYIESAGSVYTIAFLDSEPDYELRNKINKFFASIVKDYAKFFRIFDGDDSVVEVVSLTEKMQKYLNSQKISISESKKGINPAKYIFYVVFLGVAFYMGYLLSNWYFEYMIERDIQEITNQKVIVTKNQNHILLEGYIDKLETLDKIETVVQMHTDDPIENYLLVPMKNIIDIVDIRKDATDKLDKKVDKNIAQLNTQFTNEINRVKQMRSKEIVIFKEVKRDIEKEFRDKLDKLFVNNRFYIPSENSLDFRELHIFASGKINYKKETIDIISENFDKYMMILVEFKDYIDNIIIEGHTDSQGDEELNIKLSSKRASSMREYLMELPIIKNSSMAEMIVPKGIGSKEVVKIDNVEDKDASRRIKIKVKLKDNI